MVAFFECCLFVWLLGPSCRSGRINKQWDPQLKGWYVTIKGAGIIGTYQVEKIARLTGRIQACRSYIYDENHCACSSSMCFSAMIGLFQPQMATRQLVKSRIKPLPARGAILQAGLFLTLSWTSVYARDGRDNACACE